MITGRNPRQCIALFHNISIGAARTALTGLGADISDVNLFTMTALIDQTGSTAAATAQFSAHYDPVARSLQQSYVDTILTAYNLTGNASPGLSVRAQQADQQS